MPICSTTSPGTSARVAALESAVGELVDSASGDALAGAQDADLLETLVAVTGAIGRLQAVQVVVAEQVEASDACRATGWASTKDLLTHLTGGLKGTGGGILRLAEQSRTLPAVREAMLAGDVSPAQARTIGRRVATLPNAPELRTQAAEVMLGRVRDDGLDATDLDRSFPDVVATIDPTGRLLGDEGNRPRDERGTHHSRFFSMAKDAVGGFKITGYACAEDAELIAATLAPLAAPQTTEPGACGGEALTWEESLERRRQGLARPTCPDPACGHTGRDPRDHGRRTLDALVELCRRAQAVDDGPGALPRTHGTAARVTVTISLQELQRDLGTATLGSGQRLLAHAVRRMACDADIIPAVLGSHGQVLDVGRTQRLVTMGLWLALVLRDQHCSFPGCRRTPQACDAHHIRHWADGGETSLDNLALLCRRHHTLTHHSPWTVTLDPVTRRPVWHPPPPRTGPMPITMRLAPPVRQTHAPEVAAVAV